MGFLSHLLQLYSVYFRMDLRPVEFEQEAVDLARRFLRSARVLEVREIRDVHDLVSNVTKIKRDGGKNALRAN